MDVDVLENEVIVYLHRNDLRTLKSQHRINHNVVTPLKRESPTVTVDFDRETVEEVGIYDDVLDALEEIDTMLWELQEHQEEIGKVLNKYDWKKVMRTYEHYDNIRSQYG